MKRLPSLFSLSLLSLTSYSFVPVTMLCWGTSEITWVLAAANLYHGDTYPMGTVKSVERSWKIQTTVIVGTPHRLVDHTKCHQCVRPSAEDATLQTSVNFAFCRCPCSQLPAWWYLLKSYMAAASLRSVLKILLTK